MAFSLGFQIKYILKPSSILFYPVKVLLKVFSILFKVHWACCGMLQVFTQNFYQSPSTYGSDYVLKCLICTICWQVIFFRHRAHILREQVSTEGLKNMINFKKGSGESESPSSANSTSPTQPGSTSGKDTKLTGWVQKNGPPIVIE